MMGTERKGAIAFVMTMIGAGLCWAEPTMDWYYISFDNQRQITHQTLGHPQLSDPITTSGGDGDGWHYYPASDRYIMWFYNGPYSTNHITEFDMWAFIASVDSSRTISYDISMGWTTPAWSDSSSPPLPRDMPTLGDETHFIVENGFDSGDDIILREGSVEQSRSYRAHNYNPAWAFVSARGRNLMLYRWLAHETILKGAVDPGDDSSDDPGDDPGDDPPTVSGACCNSAQGQCYMTDTGTCTSGFSYRGDGSSCAACTASNAQWDFGDAPTSYGVYRVDNGARHTIVAGVHLGQGVSNESDGQPGAAATGDSLDDGVSFLGTLRRNQSARVTVTASTAGFVNGWLDLNLDGDWDDPGEQILGDRFVSPGENVLSFNVPAASGAGESYARIRFNTVGGLWHSGPAADGEVEDYRVTIHTENQTPIDLAPVPPTHQLTSVWRQPARAVDSAQGRISGEKIDTSWTQGPLVVDDWTASSPQAIQGFRWWGVFEGWTASSMPVQPPVAFHASIWSDRQGLGSPDVLLWEKTLPHWVWAYSGLIPDALGQTEDEAVFEFIAMLPQDQWFTPDESPHTRYWIALSALSEETAQQSHPWAWLTRRPSQLSPAVIVTHAGSFETGIPGPWPPFVGELVLGSRQVGAGWDMAFELISQQAADP